jgi:molybdopterin-guanine dinucleotide biosynthesis protein A
MSRRSSSDVSALILAGGKATRFSGVAKHELVVDGETIFERQVRVLAPRVAEILVSAPRPFDGYRTVRDAAEGVGPLAGIAAGLAACTTSWLLVVAGDMPYVTGELIDQLIAAADAVDAVGIRIDGLPEPLLCVLHVRVRETVERRIAAGDFKASRLLTDSDLRVHWLEDIDRAAVRNINAPADL